MGSSDYFISCGIDQWSDIHYGYPQRVAEDSAPNITDSSHKKVRKFRRIVDIWDGYAPFRVRESHPRRIYAIRLRNSMYSCHDEDGNWLSYYTASLGGELTRRWRNGGGRCKIYKQDIEILFPAMDVILLSLGK